MSHHHPETRDRDLQLSCSDAVELQPWLLNGSLEADEERALRHHLAGCESCRAELGDTADAWRLLTRHIPSLALAEYALGVTVDGLSREIVERHLAGCPTCRQELEWVAADRVVDFAAERSMRQPAAHRLVRHARQHGWAIAAGLAAVLAVGGFWTSLDRDVLQSPGEVAAAGEGIAVLPEAAGAPTAGYRRAVPADNAAATKLC